MPLFKQPGKTRKRPHWKTVDNIYTLFVNGKQVDYLEIPSFKCMPLFKQPGKTRKRPHGRQ